MSRPISKLWLLGPPVAILISLVAYYGTFRSVRDWVDARFPWVEVNIGRRLPTFANDSKTTLTPARVATPAIDTPREPAAESVRPPAPPPAPSFVGTDGKVDLPKLGADRSAWPRTVVLKRTTEFPAVVDGKVVGKVNVPLGAEAKLVAIQDGRIGLEYQGGGAWVAPADTDLAERLQRPEAGK